ncbi:MAG: hypothetical protein OEW19_01600 [Acidobacteriota bacterium]|nr:hypothetical protein [Acidobacteriota bacterium]
MPARATRHTHEVVAFLRQARAYPDAPAAVSVIETHMSWVFLTDTDVYKLKKAIRHDGIDVRAAEMRRRNCLEEVRLNRRLAPHVYLGVVAVTRDANGRFAIGGDAEPVDWLVHMRRLPADRNLDAVIAADRAPADESKIRAAARTLARFFATSPAETMSGEEHRALLTDGIRADLRHLSEERYGLPRPKVELLARAQLAFLRDCPEVFDARVDAGHIVEGHGDLRPEHIWLDPEPAILDCVEFDRRLRLTDPADELAFLALECERLGAPEVGDWFLDAYVEATGDRPPAVLGRFYRVYRSLRRASIAAGHLDDPSVTDPGRFLERARHYLDLAEPVTCRAT